MNQVEYIPSGMETVWQQKCCMIWPDPMGNHEAEKIEHLFGIAIAKLSEHLDEFKAHPNNLNHLRQQYIFIMADLAESEILSDVLTQITGYKGKWMKKSKDLGTHIRLGNYALS